MRVIILALLQAGCASPGRSYMIPAKGSANCIKESPDGSIELAICPVKRVKADIQT